MTESSAPQDQATGNPFDPSQWREVEGFRNGEDLTDLTYHRHVGEGRADGIVRIATGFRDGQARIPAARLAIA